jgi:hypothetical protein
MSIGVTLHVQPAPKPKRTRRPLAGMTGTGVAEELAVEPLAETEPVTHDGGQGVTSVVPTVPLKEVT